MLVFAAGEGDVVDGIRGERCEGLGGGLGGAGFGRQVGSRGDVKERALKGGLGIRIEGEGGDDVELRLGGSGAGVEMEGAEFAIFGREVPRGGQVEGEVIAGIGDVARGRVRGFLEWGAAMERWDGNNFEDDFWAVGVLSASGRGGE